MAPLDISPTKRVSVLTTSPQLVIPYCIFDQTIQGTSGLAFSIYPIALAKMPFGRIWAGFLFFMFFLLGISSQFGLSFCMFFTKMSSGLSQNVATSITDQFPVLAKRSWLIVIIVCLSSFLIAFATCFQVSYYSERRKEMFRMESIFKIFLTLTLEIRPCSLLSSLRFWWLFIYMVSQFLFLAISRLW